MNVTSVYEDNVQKAWDFIKQAQQNGADLISLPEMFVFSGEPEMLPLIARSCQEQLLPKMQEYAKKNKLAILTGSIPTFDSSSKKPYNEAYFIGNEGDILSRYRKTHLFQLSSSQHNIDESSNYQAGKDLAVFDYLGWRIGISICFDLRFSALFQSMSKEKPLDLLFLPSAFTKLTGQAHWHTLIKARAIEFQCYVAAANQCGVNAKNVPQYGHSLIVGPWGEVLQDAAEIEKFNIEEVSLKQITTAREKIPMTGNQRHDLYL